MYCSVSEIEKRLDPKHLAELADDDADGTTDSDVVEAAIADADALIDAALSKRYEVPFATTPALVVWLSADLAIASLFARRRESASPVHMERAREARELLDRLASGELVLGGVTSVAPDAGDSTTLDTDARFRGEALDTY